MPLNRSAVLNAYYFRHHMYTLVPRHVRDDMAWLRDAGTDTLSLAILEQDLYAARENVDIICREAHRQGLKVYAVPSRWGGLVAGAPKVPSQFAATHPETWIVDEQGSPVYSEFSGPACSVHHPATREFFVQTLDTLLNQWPIEGLIWDEPKTLHARDFSSHAKQQLGEKAFVDEAHTDAVAHFFDDLSGHVKTAHPGVQIALFLMANAAEFTLERCAQMRHLDDFGCDGRPWRASDGGTLEASGKTLLGAGERFLEAARQNGKRSLMLVENHNMKTEDFELLENRFAEVLSLGAQHLIYYLALPATEVAAGEPSATKSPPASGHPSRTEL